MNQLMSLYFYALLVRDFITFIRESLCGFNLKIIKNPKRVNHYLRAVVQKIPVFPFSEECARTGLLKLYHVHESLRSHENADSDVEVGVRFSISNQSPGCPDCWFQELRSEQQGRTGEVYVIPSQRGRL